MAVDARVCDLELEHSELSDVASAAAAERATPPPSLSSRSVAQRTDATLAKKEADARAQASRGRCCYCAPISTEHVQMDNYRSWYWARSLEVQRSRHAGY